MEIGQYLYQAMVSKYGIVISTDNPGLLRARLYKARAEAMDPALARLQFRPDPTSQKDTLWIIKGEAPSGT